MASTASFEPLLTVSPGPPPPPTPNPTTPPATCRWAVRLPQLSAANPRWNTASRARPSGSARPMVAGASPRCPTRSGSFSRGRYFRSRGSGGITRRRMPAADRHALNGNGGVLLLRSECGGAWDARWCANMRVSLASSAQWERQTRTLVDSARKAQTLSTQQRVRRPATNCVQSAPPRCCHGPRFSRTTMHSTDPPRHPEIQVRWLTLALAVQIMAFGTQRATAEIASSDNRCPCLPQVARGRFVSPGR